MSTIPLKVQVHRAGSPPHVDSQARTPLDLDADLARVRMLAQAMDAQFEIAGVRVGWDAIIGLVPLIGDAVTAAIATYPIHIARRHKLGRLLQARMAGNVLLDWAVGSIPLVGDLFDVAFKANLKNAELLARAAARRAEDR
jgi:hypothetical protein